MEVRADTVIAQLLAVTLPSCKATQEYLPICGLFMQTSRLGSLASKFASLLSKMHHITWVVITFLSFDISSFATRVIAFITSAAENELGENWVTFPLKLSIYCHEFSQYYQITSHEIPEEIDWMKFGINFGPPEGHQNVKLITSEGRPTVILRRQQRAEEE